MGRTISKWYAEPDDPIFQGGVEVFSSKSRKSSERQVTQTPDDDECQPEKLGHSDPTSKGADDRGVT